MTAAVERELRSLLPSGSVLDGTPAAYLADETATRGVSGRADAVVLPETVDEVAQVVTWCCGHGVAIVPRGGGTGFAAGAVPLNGGVVVALERLNGVRSFDPLLWRICVEAGLRTADLRRIVRQSGLSFPPDPGAAEQSQIGGNIAANAGGPHAFKYGVTGAWVTGLEAVLPPGEIVSVGGPIRKDVAGYDVKSLLVARKAARDRDGGVAPAAPCSGGFVSGRRLLPHGGRRLRGDRGRAWERPRRCRSGVPRWATLQAAGPSFPATVPPGAHFLVLAEADGSHAEAAGMRASLLDVLGGEAVAVHPPEKAAEIDSLWRWRTVSRSP